MNFEDIKTQIIRLQKLSTFGGQQAPEVFFIMEVNAKGVVRYGVREGYLSGIQDVHMDDSPEKELKSAIKGKMDFMRRTVEQYKGYLKNMKDLIGDE